MNIRRGFCTTVFLLCFYMMGLAQTKQVKSVPSGDTSSQKSPVGVMYEEYLLHTDDPDWDWVRNEFFRKYPDSNVDSLARLSKQAYYRYKGDEGKRLKELAYLANRYGDSWAPADLAQYAGVVIRYDFGWEQDALKWIKLAQEKATGEKEKKELGVTYAYILAKLGKKEEALKYAAEALPIYSPDSRYLKTDGGFGRGLMKKRTMGDLFEIEAGREVWLYWGGNTGGKNQKAEHYRGKVSFEGDKPYWKKVRDKYLVKEFEPVAADSVMLLGAMYYYESYLNDTTAWVAPFVEYSENYHNRNLAEKNSNAWEVFLKNKEKGALRKALEWSKETIHDDKNPFYYGFLDTYANLLYKLGNKSKALKFAQKALENCPEKQRVTFQATLDKMKNGEKTW